VTSVDEKKTDASTAAGAKSRTRVRAEAKAAKRSAKAANRREKAAAAGVGDSRTARLRLAVVGAPRRVVGLVRDPRQLLVALMVVGVVLAALLVTLAYFTHRHAESEAAGQEAQRVGGQEVVALLSYDYHTVRQDLPPVLNSLTGPFKDEYGRLLNTAVIPAAEQQQIVTRTTLSGSAVTDATPDHVELLMFLNQTSIAPGQQQPQLEGSRAKVTLDLVDGQWKVSGLTPM
jgi:Mce-associated membrane protein